MSYSDDARLLTEIASMYYEEGAKQSEVAKSLISVARWSLNIWRRHVL